MPLRARAAAAMARRFGSSRLTLPDGRQVRGLIRDRVESVIDGSGQAVTVRDTTARCYAPDVADLPRHAEIVVTRDDLGETTPTPYRVADQFPVGDGQHVVLTLVRLG